MEVRAQLMCIAGLQTENGSRMCGTLKGHRKLLLSIHEFDFQLI